MRKNAQRICTGNSHKQKEKRAQKGFNIFGNLRNVIKIIMPSLSTRWANIDKIYTPQCWQS